MKIQFIYIGLLLKIILSCTSNLVVRPYDLEMAVFVTSDPADQFNSPYLFVANDPVNKIDRNGAFAIQVRHLDHNYSFEIHRRIMASSMSDDHFHQLEEQLKKYASTQMEAGVENTLIRAHLLYGGEEMINSIFRKAREWSQVDFPFVASESRGIAIGLSMLTSESEDLLLDFAGSHRASSFRTWSEDGYLLKGKTDEYSFMVPGDNLKSAFDVSGELQRNIHVNLDEIDIGELRTSFTQINKELERNPHLIWDDNLAGKYGFSNFELRQITHHRSLFDRSIFYSRGKPLEHSELKQFGIEFLGK